LAERTAVLKLAPLPASLAVGAGSSFSAGGSSSAGSSAARIRAER
jgi:hypothetical protein